MEEIKGKYPRFYAVLKKLGGFVESNPKILENLSAYSGYSLIEILDLLRMDGNLTMNISEMSGKYGNTSPLSPKYRISINAAFIKGLESAVLPQTINGTSFLLAVTTLHELVHHGRFVNNLGEYPYEYGTGFEQQAFGVIVTKYNAIQLSKHYGWKL